MNKLTVDDYSAYYFDGKNQEYRHNGGYSNYTKQREYCHWVADKLVEKYPSLVGKRIIDIGCAYGYTVERLRELGVLAWGRDHSAFAISQAPAAISQYLQIGDVLDSYPANIKNAFSSRLLPCFLESEIPAIVTHLNNSFDNQLHIIDTALNENYYLIKDWSWWVGLGWNLGTILIDWNDKSREVIK